MSSAAAPCPLGWKYGRFSSRLALVLQSALGAGESETIAVALEVEADLILLDDKAARRLASPLGLPLRGTLGLLLKAKELGFIQEIRPS